MNILGPVTLCSVSRSNVYRIEYGAILRRGSVDHKTFSRSVFLPRHQTLVVQVEKMADLSELSLEVMFHGRESNN